jgi:hypothetical protein
VCSPKLRRSRGLQTSNMLRATGQVCCNMPGVKKKKRIHSYYDTCDQQFILITLLPVHLSASAPSESSSFFFIKSMRYIIFGLYSDNFSQRSAEITLQYTCCKSLQRCAVMTLQYTCGKNLQHCAEIILQYICHNNLLHSAIQTFTVV